jgi:hypothetical protein
MSIYPLLTLTDNHAAAVAVQATRYPVVLRIISVTKKVRFSGVLLDEQAKRRQAVLAVLKVTLGHRKLI